MCVFILVHGGWHGGWCWERVIPLLERAGYRALAPDLPGHGEDTMPLSARPWERYAQTISDLVAAQAEPVVLVGHSSGGMIVSEAARQAPEDVAALVYLAAFLLPEGMTPRDVLDETSGSLLIGALQVDPPAGVMTVRPEMAAEVFYHDCTAADAAWAVARLQPEPLIPYEPTADPAKHRAIDSDIPRVYIETEFDRALPLAVQQQMHAAIPCQKVYTLETSHSPFFAAPGDLAEVLVSVAETYCD